VVPRERADVPDQRVRGERARALRVLGLRVGDEGEQAREQVAREGLVREGGVRLEEEGADAVGGYFGRLWTNVLVRFCVLAGIGG
jgi:hypothetical protein